MKWYRLVRYESDSRISMSEYKYVLYEKKLFRWKIVDTAYSIKEMTRKLRNLTITPLFEGSIEQIKIGWEKSYASKGEV